MKQNTEYYRDSAANQKPAYSKHILSMRLFGGHAVSKQEEVSVTIATLLL